MPLGCFILHVLSLIFLFALNVQGQIYLPLGNVTYWSAGSHVKLPWKYNFSSTDILLIQWTFTSTKTGTPENMAVLGTGAAEPTIINPLFNVTDQATLEFKNVDITYNGTYSFKVSLKSDTNQRTSKVEVIILQQPTLEVTCSKKDLFVKEGENVLCWCNGTSGNPPPTASWSKNGTAVNGTGYLTKLLFLNNVTQEKTGVYNCTVRSHNLTNTRLITIKLKEKTKPANIIFKINKPSNDLTVGDSVVMTCEADAYPDPEYVIIFNGARLNRTHAGEYTINSSSLNDTGTYECVAKNMLGNVSKAIFLTVKAEEKITVTPGEPSTPTEPLSTSSSTKKGEGQDLFQKLYVVIPLVCILLILLIVIVVLGLLLRRRRSRHPTTTENVPLEMKPPCHVMKSGDDQATSEKSKKQKSKKESFQESGYENPADGGYEYPSASADVDATYTALNRASDIDEHVYQARIVDSAQVNSARESGYVIPFDGGYEYPSASVAVDSTYAALEKTADADQHVYQKFLKN